MLDVRSYHITLGVPKNTIGYFLIRGKGRKRPPSLSNIDQGAYERARYLLKCKAKLLNSYLKNKTKHCTLFKPCMNVGEDNEQQAFISKSQNQLTIMQAGN